MGHNFVDLIPLDVCPAIVETGDSLAGASLTSKFQTTTMFPGVSSAVFDVYVEYVPRPVPRGPRSVGKRGRADCSSGLSAAKKSRQSSTHPGTPVVASMLLGGHINTLYPFVFSVDVSPPIACHGGTQGSLFRLWRMQNLTVNARDS